jgi:hypothetical protein
MRKDLSGIHLTIIEKTCEESRQPHRNGNGSKVPPTAIERNGLHPSSPAEVISASALPDLIKQTSLAIFRRLTQAEASISPQCRSVCPQSQQIGEIVTVVGVVAGLSLLGITRVECSPIHVGSGVTYSAEGIRPALSPVAAEILCSSSVPVYGSHVAGELVTPVGAAIITTIASAFGAIPAMKISAVGYGAGHQDLKETPNLVRLFIGEKSAEQIPNSAPNNIAHSGAPEPVSSLQATSDAKAFIATQEEWSTLTVKGHQQSGRQRLAS